MPIDTLVLHSDQAGGHEAGGRVGHEIEIARPSCRDYWLAQKHGFGQDQPESFGPVQGQQHVAAAQEVEVWATRESALDHANILRDGNGVH
jgi:hypothetical protein